MDDREVLFETLDLRVIIRPSGVGEPELIGIQTKDVNGHWTQPAELKWYGVGRLVRTLINVMMEFGR